MSYNIFFDIAAILNLLIVIYAYLIHKKLHEFKNRMFFYLCCVTLCSTITDFLAAYFSSNTAEYSVNILWLINCLYFVFVCAIPLFFELYCVGVVDEARLLDKQSFKVLLFLPVFIQLVLIVLTPTFKLIFTITETGEYIRGTFVNVLYGLMIYQIALGICVLIKYRAKVPKTHMLFTVSFIVITMIGVVIQFIFDKLLIQHFAISISLLLIYNTLQVSDIIIDPVTGLLNQKAFISVVNSYFKRYERFCVICVSLDDMSFMTTTFGVEGLKAVMKQITDFLKEICPFYKIFQIEKNQFCILIPDCDPEKYSYVNNKIKKRFSTIWKNDVLAILISARQCNIRCSRMGMKDNVDYAENAEKVMDIINTIQTDSRYKTEKQIFSENIDVSTRKRFTHVDHLVKTSISENRISVYYQPIYSTREKRIVGAEALVRMKDTAGNNISPEEFVPIAEQNGMILRIGQYVFEQVCFFVSNQNLMKCGVQFIDVNLSVAQCMQTSISDELFGVLKAFSLPSSVINFEITETQEAHTPKLLYDNMNRLTELGFSCSLDDYGSGYANLNYILNMPFSMIKIDKEIVWRAMKDLQAYVMLVGIIDMIHKMGKKVVAEGIETEEMVQKLTDLKCDYLQGFYYSRPVPQEEFYNMVKDLPGVEQTSFDPEIEYIEDDVVEELEEITE